MKGLQNHDLLQEIDLEENEVSRNGCYGIIIFWQSFSKLSLCHPFLNHCYPVIQWMVIYPMNIASTLLNTLRPVPSYSFFFEQSRILTPLDVIGLLWCASTGIYIQHSWINFLLTSNLIVVLWLHSQLVTVVSQHYAYITKYLPLVHNVALL